MVQACWLWSSPSQFTSLSILCAVGSCERHSAGLLQVHCACRPAMDDIGCIDLRSSEKHGSGVQPGLWWVEEDFDSTRSSQSFPRKFSGVSWNVMNSVFLCVWDLLCFFSIVLATFDSSLCYLQFICIIYCENSDYKASLLLVPKPAFATTLIQGYWPLPFASALRMLPGECFCPCLCT